MGTRGDEKERVEGQHDSVELSPAERAAFDQLQAGYNDPSDSSQTPQGGFYRPSSSPYDQHSGYTRRYGPNNDGYTRRDPNQHAGYTRRGHGGTKSPSELRDAEDTSGKPSRRERAKSLAANGLAGLRGSEKQGSGEGESPFSYTNNGPRWSKARGFMQKHRKKVIVAGVAGIGVVPLVALLFFLLGALKIPHLVENVAAWRFAKVTNQYRTSVSNVMNEKTALDSLDDGARNAATAKYGKYAVFDKINRLRPNRVLQSLHASDRIQYEYKKTLFGRQKLVSITITPDNDPRTRVKVNVPSSKFDGMVHWHRTIDQYKTISDALNSAMKAHDPKIPLLTRAAATRLVLQKAGASLKGMAASKYLGKTDREAKITITQEAYEKAHRDGAIAGIGDEKTKQQAQEANDTSDQAMQDKEQVGDMVDKGKDMPDSVVSAIQNGTDPGRMRAIADQVIGVANPAYDLAAQICMISEGSKLTPEGVDAQHDAMVSEAAYVFSTGDQQKSGADVGKALGLNAQAINAMNWKLGNVQDSNAIRRVSGKPVNTLDTMGGERTTFGGYRTTTIFDVFGLGVFNSVVDTLCPTLTNIWFGVGVGAINITAAIFTGGTSDAAATTISSTTAEAAKKTLTSMVAKTITTATKKTAKTFGAGGRFAKDYGKSVAKYTAVTAAGVFLARDLVYHKAGLNASGAEKGPAIDDNVDNGAEMLSSDIGRQHFRARPLNNVETAQSHESDRAERGYNNKQLNTFQRYLSIENPNSMLSRTALTTGSLMERSTFASALNSIATVFNPVGLMSKMFATMNAKTTIAAGNVDTEDYGNVVWAQSAEEKRLLQQDSYASPSENADILASSGKEQEINDKYDKCYTDSIGTLLTSGDIVRDDNGDVLDQGDCSPLSLGPHNPTYGDLVFRWRTKYNYENTLDLILGVQDPVETANNTMGNLGDIPTGTAQELAKQILNNNNIKFQVEPTQRQAMEKIAATGKGSTCGSPAVSPKLLGIILAAASKYKLVLGVLVDGHRCNNGYHPRGQAVDINGVSTIDGSDSTGNDIGGNDFASSKVLRSFYGEMGELVNKAGGGEIGQYSCFASPKPSKSSNVSYVDDTCNHVHVGVSNQ